MARVNDYITNVATIDGETVCKYCAATPVKNCDGGYHNNDYEEWYECTCDTAKKVSELKKVYDEGLNAKREIDRLEKTTAIEVVEYQLKSSLKNVICNHKSIHKISDKVCSDVLRKLLD